MSLPGAKHSFPSGNLLEATKPAVTKKDAVWGWAPVPEGNFRFGKSSARNFLVSSCDLPKKSHYLVGASNFDTVEEVRRWRRCCK